IDEHHRFYGWDVTVVTGQLDIREWCRDGERQEERRRDGKRNAPLLRRRRDIGQRNERGSRCLGDCHYYLSTAHYRENGKTAESWTSVQSRSGRCFVSLWANC